MRQGALYLMTCQKCQREGRQAYYVGETARTPYDRGVEHFTAMKKGNTESPMVEHEEEYHGGLQPDFTMEVIGNPASNIQRQLGEYHQMLKYGDKGVLLNRRGEWGQNLPPQLQIQENSSSEKETKGAYNSSRGPGGDGGHGRGETGGQQQPHPHHQKAEERS